MKTIKLCLLILLFSCLVACQQLNIDNSLNSDRSNNKAISTASNLSEVAIPKTIDKLSRDVASYVPQVKIITPKTKQTFAKTDVSVEIEVENLPIFKDEELQLGNHLNLIVDNEPFQSIYSFDQPIIIKDLTPGTHTIRVFAVSPWGESYKNEGAYAQTTFNVLTETNDNLIDPGRPLLTYNSPTGSYGAQPVLLDFYLTNALLHAIAKNNSNLQDWLIRATVNGTSFILEDWQPIYLTGFKPGENWIQLELIDAAGNNIENAYNNTVRVFTYNPEQNDTLARLVTEQITLAQAQSLVRPDSDRPKLRPETIDLQDSIEPDLQNNTESKTIVDDSADAVVEPDTATTPPIADDEPTVSIASEAEEDRITTTAQTELETAIIEPEQEPEIAQPDLEPEITSNPVAVDDLVQPKTSSENKNSVTISEANSDGEQPLTTIEIPQPESVEVKEKEVEIVIPPTEPKPKADSLLWWKKILVGLRQKIEALAKTLPDRV